MERLFRRKKQKGETVKNKKKNRRKQRRKVILILLAVLVLGLVVIFGLFRVRKLVISGNKQYKAEEIQEAIIQRSGKSKGVHSVPERSRGKAENTI